MRREGGRKRVRESGAGLRCGAGGGGGGGGGGARSPCCLARGYGGLL
eukprot:COSAG03_NODE_13774_length_488_cov_66.388175_1_plen_46_part_10